METHTYSISPSVKKGIMRRVYGAWFFKLMAPVVFFELPAFLIILKLISNYVFVQKVLENMAVSFSGAWSLVTFFSNAFVHTHFHTQVSLLLGTVIGILLVKDSMKILGNIFRVLTERSISFR